MAEESTLNEREEKVLGRMKARAQKIVNDHDRLKEVLKKAQKKLDAAQEDDTLLRKLTDYVKLILRMITNYLNGAYNETPWQTIVMLVAGLLYFITPLDAIPDFIPIGGWIDDATVLVWLGRCFRDDLERYKIWEGRNHSEG